MLTIRAPLCCLKKIRGLIFWQSQDMITVIGIWLISYHVWIVMIQKKKKKRRKRGFLEGFSHRLKVLLVEEGVPNSWLPLCVFTDLPSTLSRVFFFFPSFFLLYYSLSPLGYFFPRPSLRHLPSLGGCICHLGRSGHHLPPLISMCVWGTSALVFKKPPFYVYVNACVRPSWVARSCSHLNPCQKKLRGCVGSHW